MKQDNTFQVKIVHFITKKVNFIISNKLLYGARYYDDDSIVFQWRGQIFVNLVGQ